jgi:hypothetical protein
VPFFALVLVAVALVFAVAAMMLFLLEGKILSVQAFVKLLLCGIAHGNDLYLEVEGLAGELVVEVHGHGIFLDLCNCSLDDVSCAVEHRDHGAYLEEVFAEYASDFERTLGDVDTEFGIDGAVAFFGAYGDAEFVARFVALEALFEAGYHHMRTVDVLQGLSLRGFVDLFSFYGQAVCHCDHFVLFNFHIFFLNVSD